ncbi:hypothetical protein GCM10023205_11070 [Yinghuangia aomiensis]|uniref:Uncharacterized protein n=1 Tax=Yinghuangia aomiensis TaxID=676205 RepID=A0ABP9GSW1_9ACTN
MHVGEQPVPGDLVGVLSWDSDGGAGAIRARMVGVWPTMASEIVALLRVVAAVEILDGRTTAWTQTMANPEGARGR